VVYSDYGVVAIANGGTSSATVVGAKTNLGLENVDNTTDLLKPVSTATQTALALKANIASPTFTGTPLAPTAAAGTSTTQLATTVFVTAADATHTANIATNVTAIALNTAKTSVPDDSSATSGQVLQTDGAGVARCRNAAVSLQQ
jgi:hypothetical protein